MIQPETVRHIAKLARLRLDEPELALYTSQLGRILGFFDELASLDTTGVPPTAHPLPVHSALRDDQPARGLPIEQALANAPQAEGRYFRVPRILES